MTDDMFRVLTFEETQKFRQWARENWKPGDPVNEVWHPVVRDECRKIEEENRSLQESPSKKVAWLDDAKKRVPVGTRVKVVVSDVLEYVGVLGTVIDYDLGIDGEWPMVCVVFDTPIKHVGSADPTKRDAFYCDGNDDDELVKE